MAPPVLQGVSGPRGMKGVPGVNGAQVGTVRADTETSMTLFHQSVHCALREILEIVKDIYN